MAEKTLLTNIKERFENNKYFVVLVIFLIVFFAVAKVMKSGKDIKDSFGSFTTNEEVKENPSSPTVEIKKEQTFQITGKVVNEQDLPVQNARVELVGVISSSILSDSHGDFQIDFKMEESSKGLELLISKKDYKVFSKKMNIKQRVNNLGRLHLVNQLKANLPKNKKNPPTSKQPESSHESKTILKDNTINGNVITNPTGPIEITNNYTTPKDTTQNE